MEGSRQRARELQWELKAAQLTATGLQEQVWLSCDLNASSKLINL